MTPFFREATYIRPNNEERGRELGYNDRGLQDILYYLRF